MDWESSSQLHKQLEERHTESCLKKQILYLTDYEGVARANSSGIISPVPLEDLPAIPALPNHHWLMQVYVQDVLSKLDEVNTSMFGQFIKMDSTKKTVRKLAGQDQV